MHDLARNKQIIYYKNYLGETEIVDEYGNATGQYEPMYSALKTCKVCVSPNKGTSEIDMFGNIADYDRQITTADTSIDIDENSILWIDKPPYIEENGAEIETSHDYICKKRALWKNSLSLAIKKVDVKL